SFACSIRHTNTNHANANIAGSATRSSFQLQFIETGVWQPCAITGSKKSRQLSVLDSKLPATRRRYAGELKGNPAVAELRKLGNNRRVTLLYGARGPKVSHALVLKAALSK